MKNKFLIFVFVFVVIIFLMAVDKCGNSLKYNKLKAEYSDLEKSFKINTEISKAVIAEKDKEIAEADRKINELESSIKLKNEDIENLDEKLGELEGAYSESLSKDEQIANLKQQVKAWKGKFALAEKIIADKDKIIFSLTRKYEAQVTITLEWQSRYNGVIALNENLGLQVKTLKRQISRLKLGSGMKNVLIIAAVIYGLVK